jgi:hypothetical protein
MTLQRFIGAIVVALLLGCALRAGAATPDYSEDLAAIDAYGTDQPGDPPQLVAMRTSFRQCIALDMFMKRVEVNMRVSVTSAGTYAAYDASGDAETFESQGVPASDALWAERSLLPRMLRYREVGAPIGATFRRELYLACLKAKGVK